MDIYDEVCRNYAKIACKYSRRKDRSNHEENKRKINKRHSYFSQPGIVCAVYFLSNLHHLQQKSMEGQQAYCLSNRYEANRCKSRKVDR